MIELPYVHPTTAHMLVAATRAEPEREALICGSDRLTYSDYLRLVMVFADELIALGATNERVALVMGNSVDICIGMFAAHTAGAQVVPLNPVYTARELAPMIQDAEPRVILYDSAVSALVEPLAHDIPHRIRIGPDGRRLTHASTLPSLEECLARELLPDPGSLATLQYTGGTTGRSKGVNLTQGAICTNISQRQALVPASHASERILCVMPLFHVYAVAMCLHNAAYCCGTLLILPRFQAEAVFDHLEHERITILAGSPTVFTGLLASPRFSQARFPHLQTSYSGSAPLAEGLLVRWEEVTGAPVIEGYGQTESGPVISFNPLHGVRKPRSVGLPLPQTVLQIVDSATGSTELPAGQIGEIRVRGPQLMSGYRNLPQETAETLRDGWLYTGDLGEVDVDGYLYIRDRKKDMFLVSGFNVYPREIEEVLYLHPSVKEAAVLSTPDAYRGSLVTAYVALSDASIDEAVLDAHCRRNLAPYKVPRHYVFLASLPKTSVGKIDKKSLQ